ncbi:MAG: hypothetical protein U1E29_11970, partial [Coriobacteriia bacterium]|nr:hypothetical protein [Coriobacteriia bacterium]
MAAEVIGALADIGSEPVVVVLDDVPLNASFAAISELAGILVSQHADSRVLLTTRQESPVVLGQLGRQLVIDSEMLRLSKAECSDLIGRYLGDPVDEQLADSILSISGGRPATVCVVARQAALGTADALFEGAPSLDLRSHLLALSESQFGPDARLCLYACSMLRS